MKALSMKMRLGLALLPLLALGACEVPQEAVVESRAKAVLDAQYAATAKTPPMQAEEAARIYKNYIENIGEPMESRSTTTR